MSHRTRSRWDPDWCCPLCQVWIFGRKNSCVKCKTPKIKIGDWVCVKCRIVNFSSRTKCRQCDSTKPIICKCTDPIYAQIVVNGNFEPLGTCHKCLLPNPVPWYDVLFDRFETQLRNDQVPSEYWLYEYICGHTRKRVSSRTEAISEIIKGVKMCHGRVVDSREDNFK